MYDNEQFSVSVESEANGSYLSRLTNASGIVTANAQVSFPQSLPVAPQRRGDPVADDRHQAPLATPDNMRRLMSEGCYAFSYRWDSTHPMSRYLRDRQQMAPCYFEQQKANPAFILGVSNWVLAANAIMNPWVHMETSSQNFASINLATEIIAEMNIDEVFEKKGHQFVDVTVNLFDAVDNRCYSNVKLRAIYQLRGL